MMSFMVPRFFSFFIFLFLSACATGPVKNVTWDKLWSQVKMEGEGKARLEIPPESWVFSFEAVLKKNDWLMAITIPLKGEESFAFPGLDRPRPEIVPAADDFRWQVIQALRAASHERSLAYPQLGQDFVTYLHHLLRWTHADSLGLARGCDATSTKSWNCRWDGVPSNWSWDERKEEFIGVINLKTDWKIRALFKNLTGSVFKRVTLEVTRKTESASVVELRQEFFFY
jgi:hypothetical protein